ncbi:hypothetical protein NC651_007877 [Populus alba x Populus x berolinensis]|nr:hypothetical protein NC651_007877 [Populus alba x Populus x berolinensis]
MQVCHCKHCIDDVSQLLETIKLKLKHHEFLCGSVYQHSPSVGAASYELAGWFLASLVLEAP